MQIHRPILCEECQYAAKARILRPSRTIEPRFSRSDYIPSESERIQLRNVLKEGEREIECYEGLWAILDQLETRKRALELTTIQCRAALSVHRRIPAEVWGMIFSTLCLELHEYSFDVDVDDVSPLLQLPALLISQVCSRWRNIVQGLPSVWSSINADAFHWNGYRTFNDPLKVYLAHSKGYPLTLRIAFPELLTPCVYNVWNTLSRHIGRSRKLTMAVDCEDIDDIHPIRDLTFPNLELFEEMAPPVNDTWHWFWKAIHEAPKLVRFSSIYMRDSLVPFSQLTVWELRALTWAVEVENLLNILPRCMCLISLKIKIESYDDESSVVARDVMLPFLRRLSIKVVKDEQNWLSSIFQSIGAPSLEFCDVSCKKRLLSSSLLAMIRRSSASLKHMVLTSDHLSPSDDTDITFSNSIVFELLQTASELTHFEFQRCGGGYDLDGNKSRLFDDIVSTLLLKLKNDPRDFLPKLSLLSIELPLITLDTQLVERVLEVVSARQTTPRSLKGFRLVRSRCIRHEKQYVIEPEMLERVDLLAKNGIEVVIEDNAGIKS